MKIVKERIDENWVSSDTGINRYATEPPRMEVNDVVDRMKVPNTIKFTPEDFEDYIDNLIDQIVPKSPMLAYTIFREVIKEHPYLTRKGIGFKPTNPYEESIEKFIRILKNIKEN